MEVPIKVGIGFIFYIFYISYTLFYIKVFLSIALK